MAGVFGRFGTVVVAAAFVAGFSTFCARTQGLEISGGGLVGDAVSITGPDEVLKAIGQCKYGPGWFGAGGNGLTVDWGDGAQPFAGLEVGKDCSERQRTHVYSVPGEYTVRAVRWHPGPTDAPVTDWQGAAQVRVAGQTAADSIEIDAIGVHEFRYQEPVPVKWTASTAGNTTLAIEALAEDGSVLSRSRERRWSVIGSGQAMLRMASKEYDRALQSGQDTFVVRVSLLRDGAVVASASSGPLKMSARHTPYMERQELQWVKAAGPHAFRIGLHTYHPECLSYRVEWGDGEITEKVTPARKTCALDGRTVELGHVYGAAGTYRIKVTTNNYRTFGSLEDNVAYAEAEVSVTD